MSITITPAMSDVDAAEGFGMPWPPPGLCTHHSSLVLTLSVQLCFLTRLKTQAWQIYIYSDTFGTGRRDFLKKHWSKIKILPCRSVLSVCTSCIYQSVCECWPERKGLLSLGLICHIGICTSTRKLIGLHESKRRFKTATPNVFLSQPHR